MNDLTLVPFQIDAPELSARLASVVRQKTPKIAVVGDFCLDKYLYVYPELDEISVETGMTAFQVRAKRSFAGVGGTITNNLRALGAETYCFGVVGEDGEGFDLLKALKKTGANVDGMIVSDEIITSSYVKPMRPSGPTKKGSLQQPSEGEWTEGNRIDLRNPTPVPLHLIERLKQALLESIVTFDAVVISDQFPSGSEVVFSDDLRKFLANAAKDNPNVFFLCDSRFFVNEYRHALVKCNASELFDAYDVANGAKDKRETTLGPVLEARESELCRVGKWMAKRNKQPVLVTRGALGSILIEPKNNSDVAATAIPAVTVKPPIDICGAGDATNAGFAYAKSLGFSLTESAFLAGVVSSITIKQIGVTGTASIEQILNVLKQMN